MKRILLLITLLFLFSGCSEDDLIVIHLGEPQIFPLAVGNEWTYFRNEIDSLGVLSDSTDTLTYTVLDELTGSLYGYYSMEVTSSSSLNSGFLYLKNNSSGMWQLNEQVTPYTSSLVLQFPADVGDSYQWGSRGVTVLSVDTSITVPAGTFECYHYLVGSGDTTLADLSTVNNLFYAPDIGYISNHLYTYQSSVRIKYSLQELQSYSVE